MPGGIVGNVTGALEGAGLGVLCANAADAATQNRTAAKMPTTRDFILQERIALIEGSSIVIRLASTVMLVRPARADNFEVFMLRRSAKSAFAPDVFVFPGGTVDDADYDPALLARFTGLDEERLARMFRAEQTPHLDDSGEGVLSVADARALMVAALRELFEEAGVLLGAGRIESVDATALHQARKTLFAGKQTFLQTLIELGVELNAGELEFFSQWITPPSEGRRFNAHFFVARDDGQQAIADRYETHDEIWIAPRIALERCAAGSYAMVYPTIKHIERLAQFDSIDDLMQFANEKQILQIMPHTTADQGFTLPSELEHAW
ncbi:MAG: NUDIX hydrolase [Vulcanimicrobiaceae bacterium]